MLKAIKIKTILTIFNVYYNRFFPQNLNHWLLEGWNDKSSNADSKKYIQCFKFMLSLKKRAQQCLPRFLRQGCHFGTCKSMGSSPVQTASTFYTSTERLTRLKLLSEMCLYLDSGVLSWDGCFTIIFAGSFHYFKPVSCWILFCENVASVPRPFNQFPSCMGKVNRYKTPDMYPCFDSDVWAAQMSLLLDLFLIFKLNFIIKINSKVRPT